MNTDVQALGISKAQKKVAIGYQLTGGLGAGGNPAVGENAAKEDIEKITNIVKGADMVIITAGMGGGTGTGSAPIVAGIAKKEGALTIAVVTTPYEFEGPVRMQYAEDGIKKLRANVDSLIVIPNQQVMKIIDKKTTYRQAFSITDNVLCQGVQGISEIITKPGIVNIDFADVRAVMQGRGDAIMGVGVADGENRSVQAAQAAINNPMLENRHIDGARYILVNITSAEDLSMTEVEEIVNNIRSSANPMHQLFWGQSLDPSMENKVAVTVIATGFENSNEDENGSESKSPIDDTVVDYGVYQNVMKSKVPLKGADLEAAKTESQDTLKDSDNATLFGNAEIPSIEKDTKEDLSLSATLHNAIKSNRGIEPPADFTRREGDLTQPACWRKLNGLSRSIDLTDD